MRRDYGPVLDEVARGIRRGMSGEERMQRVADALWRAFGGAAGGVSWVGFYLPAPGGDAMVLGPRRDKPACSPIGLHGVCGRALERGTAVVVDDVRTLGESYIACDPADRSELVVPLIDNAGRPWAVIDLDSRDTRAFGETDVTGIADVLAAAGLLGPNTPPP